MKRRFSILLSICGVMLLAIACDEDTVAPPPPPSMPDDFGVVYQYSNGPVAPPNNYSYQINASVEGDGLVIFLPHEETWPYEFETDAQALSDLYDLAYSEAYLRNTWTRDEDPPAGAPTRTIKLEAAGREYEIPSDVADPDTLDSFYAQVDSLVPAEIWSSFQARRDSMLSARP